MSKNSKINIPEIQEEQIFKKVHRLIDCFEWSVKWHTVLAILNP